jgi:hypothetical protein
MCRVRFTALPERPRDLERVERIPSGDFGEPAQCGPWE